MATNDIGTSRFDISSVIGYAFIPAVLGFLVFGPGLTGGEGLLIRIFLGFLWIIGSLTALGAAAFAFFRRKSSRETKQNSLSALAGYALVVAWLFLTYPTQERITSMVNSNIPVGSSKSQVKAFLNSKQIFNEKFDSGLSATMSDKIINNGESAFIVDFYFDKQDKMSRFEVHHWQETNE